VHIEWCRWREDYYLIINKFENKEERFLYGGRVKIISSVRMLAERKKELVNAKLSKDIIAHMF
jgi:hypothetical protein